MAGLLFACGFLLFLSPGLITCDATLPVRMPPSPDSYTTVLARMPLSNEPYPPSLIKQEIEDNEQRIDESHRTAEHAACCNVSLPYCEMYRNFLVHYKNALEMVRRMCDERSIACKAKHLEIQDMRKCLEQCALDRAALKVQLMKHATSNPHPYIIDLNQLGSNKKNNEYIQVSRAVVQQAGVGQTLQNRQTQTQSAGSAGEARTADDKSQAKSIRNSESNEETNDEEPEASPDMIDKSRQPNEEEQGQNTDPQQRKDMDKIKKENRTFNIKEILSGYTA